jgi:two-component system sensor histidine kinase BaeS
VRRRVPLHRSLRVRLLGTSVLIALCSVAATAWLAVHATTQAVHQQQGQVLADDAEIYDTLVGYAAVHPDWSGVGPTVRALAARTGHRIALTTPDRRVLADSAPAASLLPSQTSATVDPLNVDRVLAPASDVIDPHAVGPYALTARERAGLVDRAQAYVKCANDVGVAAQLAQSPDGRPEVKIGNDPKQSASYFCGDPALIEPTTTEQKALDALNLLVNRCLAPRGLGPVTVNIDFSWLAADARDAIVPEPEQQPKRSSGPVTAAATDTAAGQSAITACIGSARRRQLKPYVAPAALLFVAEPQGAAAPVFRLTSADTDRIVGVTALVLLLTVALTVLVGTRLVRPLTILTEAVQNPADRHARAPVTRHDEIGYLTAAFNDLSARRERSEEQRTAMVGDIAHELRTPLSNIRGWLEAVHDGVAASDEALLASLLEEALLLQHIVDDLQDLAAADAGELRIHPEPVHVGDLLDQVVAAHRARALAAGVRLGASVDGDPELTADPVRLRQAVGNLVSNAVRHTPGGGSVTVTCRQTGGQVSIEVADTGSGIEPENLPRIFDRFWRADKSRTRRTGGSGLGLPIARRLVEAHGGAVTATSVPGESTVFTIRLPQG